jgi:lipoic acid synthetase
MQSKRRPNWLRVEAKFSEKYHEIKALSKSTGLHTVCDEAGCPNIYECYASSTATFLILGNKCSRSCKFCLIEKGKPDQLDVSEPKRVAEAVKKLNLKYAVITSVTRDDLRDGGARIFAKTVEEIRNLAPSCAVELLIPDFQGSNDALVTVIDALPNVINHNIETVRGLFPEVRKKFSYRTSLDVLSAVKQKTNGILTKSGLVLGMGEKWDEILETVKDLVSVKCDILTIGQYLSPSRRHMPVSKYYTPEEFVELKKLAHRMGIPKVVSGPLVRSSYHAQLTTLSLQRFHNQHDPDAY